MNKRKIMYYALIISFINVLAVTALLVYLNYHKVGKSYPREQEKTVVKKELPKAVKKLPKVAKPQATKKRVVEKPKEVKSKPKPIKKAPKKQCRKLVICPRYPEGACCRKPDRTSIPASLKNYYNYDPIRRVWVWRG